MRYKHITLIPALLVFVLTACGSDDDMVTPAPVNTAPTTADVELVTQTDQNLSGTLSASDADGDTLTFSIDMLPRLGSIELMANGEFVYTPPFEVTGTDSFTFTVNDGNNGEASGTVIIQIETLEVDSAQYSRQAFQQSESDTPLSVNGRLLLDNQDDDFADLLVD
ncbi:Ig-like domain-containing protein [Planctobacterium marinum]|uniref:Ig-like domain-containing protein n=1 Tax=Planctobacterium marinum TaxID=1631968 RepID=UPI001E2EAD8D|nr:Ig-like domain-containing protein [Planctobacterium marinum]MCC2606705.1 Ig-like domain-containing protein [Planctobacterium marinum]